MMHAGPRRAARSQRVRPWLVAPLLVLLFPWVAPVLDVAARGGVDAGGGVHPPRTDFLAGLIAPVARAADDGLDIRTEARYAVEPQAGVIAVTVDVRVTNTTPDQAVSTPSGPATSYSYYEGVLLAVQPEAARVRATEGTRSLAVTVRRRDGYSVVEIRFRERLYYRDTVTVRLRYDLAGGAPRSASDVRVGTAFASFVAWAFGDQGSVRIDLPQGFTVDSTEGDSLEREREDGRTVLRATTATPDEWFAWVAASNDAALTRDPLQFSRGRVVIRAWPEDETWRLEVSDVVGRGLPVLQDLIGLDWPVAGDLEVIEIHTPLLEGYAGFFDTSSNRITMSEEIDDHTIVHEISHAWFDEERFGERWIFEGLADEYAARVMGRLGLEVHDPDPVTRADSASFALTRWGPPTRIDDEETEAREQYGYDASWALMRRIIDLAGEDGMRAVFAVAGTDTIAYVGTGTPERVRVGAEWQWFLDTVEELGGATGVDELILEWVVPPGQSAVFAARTAARADYHDLVDKGDGWRPGLAVREPLATWRFDVAEARIDDARDVLDRRDRVATRADAEGLRPPDGLRSAYEGAAGSLDDALALAAGQEAALAAVIRAGDAVEAPRDWLLELGLLGEAPEALPQARLAAARDAWEAGDLDGAVSIGAAVEEQLAAAPETGRSRAIAGAVALGGGVVVLGGTTIVLRRRRRRPPGSAPADVPGGTDGASGGAGSMPGTIEAGESQAGGQAVDGQAVAGRPPVGPDSRDLPEPGDPAAAGGDGGGADPDPRGDGGAVRVSPPWASPPWASPPWAAPPDRLQQSRQPWSDVHRDDLPGPGDPPEARTVDPPRTGSADPYGTLRQRPARDEAATREQAVDGEGGT